MTIDEIKSSFDNNFVDISIDTAITDRFTPTAFLEMIGDTGARSIEFNPYTSESEIKVTDLSQNISDDELSMDMILDLYCDQKSYDTHIRTSITDKFRVYLKELRNTQKIQI